MFSGSRESVPVSGAARRSRVPGFPQSSLYYLCRLHCVCPESISCRHVHISLHIHPSLMWQLLMVSNSPITLDCATGLYQLTWRVLIKDTLCQKCALWSFGCMQGGVLNKGLLKCTNVCTHIRIVRVCAHIHAPIPANICGRTLNSGIFWTVFVPPSQTVHLDFTPKATQVKAFFCFVS